MAKSATLLSTQFNAIHHLSAVVTTSLSINIIYLYIICIAERDRNSAAGVVSDGDVVNGEMMSGEMTPNSDTDSSLLDVSGDADPAVSKQDIITITGRQENCEAAREAMLVGITLSVLVNKNFVILCSVINYDMQNLNFQPFWTEFQKTSRGIII